MAAKKKLSVKKAVRSAVKTDGASGSTSTVPAQLNDFLTHPALPKGYVNPKPVTLDELRTRMAEMNITSAVPLERFLDAVNRIKPATVPTVRLPEEIKSSVRGLRPEIRRFHGVKLALSWFSFPGIVASCADKFGYMSPLAIRLATKLPFTADNRALLDRLGDMMGDPDRDPNPKSHTPADPGVSSIPAGFTYFGQFVDHDITFDVSSSLDVDTDANTINNMRSPALDLDSVYGRGPGLDPFLYAFPASGPSTAIKFQTGTNRNTGRGGPSSDGEDTGMVVQSTFDVPRVPGSNTAIIGDPRNDENLIVVQFHHAMLRFHNAVVDLLLTASFAGDIFAEAKRIVTHHYQWAVAHDFLKRVCGAAQVSNALASVAAPIGSPFRMPVEFSVAAYRFGHSMIRDLYFVNFNFKQAKLAQVFEFNRNPRLPVFSNWVVDFNAYFDTGTATGTHNKARRIDSFIANGLESMPPDFTGLMAVLARRNLRRGLALGLPSGQGMALAFGIVPLTAAQLTQGLPVDEVTLLNARNRRLLKKTPLWYYILREAAVLHGGNQLGPVGGRIVAETFVRMLKRDASSYLNVGGGFSPTLPAMTSGDFTVADLVTFAGVTVP